MLSNSIYGYTKYIQTYTCLFWNAWLSARQNLIGALNESGNFRIHTNICIYTLLITKMFCIYFLLRLSFIFASKSIYVCTLFCAEVGSCCLCSNISIQLLSWRLLRLLAEPPTAISATEVLVTTKSSFL